MKRLMVSPLTNKIYLTNVKDKQLLEKAYTTPKKFAECIDTIFSNNIDKIAHYFGVKSDRDNISVDMLMEWLIEDSTNYADFIGFIDSFMKNLRTDK